MTAQWSDAARSPKGVSAEAFLDRLKTLPEPSPEASYEASKAPNDLLHEATWGEGDQVWAQRARLDYHRNLIQHVVETVVVGQKEITVRAVEFVRTNGHGHWAMLEQIRGNPDLLQAYATEVGRLLEQATAKHAKLRELMAGRG